MLLGLQLSAQARVFVSFVRLMELIPWGELRQQGSSCISKMVSVDWLRVTLVHWVNPE